MITLKNSIINIVLVEPRIPQNTGNIGRLALASNARLHLVHPLGFVLDSKEIKRSGMDYFDKIDLVEWDCLSDFLSVNPVSNNHFFLSTKASKSHFSAKFSNECFLIFGREDKGLDKELLKANYNQCFKIPILNEARSLNLANAVSIVVYEAIRQINN
ncbi:MAG: tRNA (cytidine(34)-2'-O)-methyltransferase [Helicobacteraceae bacterium]|nr:tRNA (cytidine(34)-2'-O)-methyltransferase [Helicobacteraceae bacterium]